MQKKNIEKYMLNRLQIQYYKYWRPMWRPVNTSNGFYLGGTQGIECHY